MFLRSATMRALGSAGGWERWPSWLGETLVPAIVSAMAKRRERYDSTSSLAWPSWGICAGRSVGARMLRAGGL